MPHGLIRKILVSFAIVALHLPLILWAMSLHARLAPGQDITDLGPVQILFLLALFALPYAALALAGIRWNPQRARLNEALD